jgi:2-oxoglutarate dehydrogenase E1 component
LAAVLARYGGRERVRWVQEEARNRGAWTFAHERLQPLVGATPIEYIGRPEGASPAAGSHKLHESELEALLKGAFASGGPVAHKKGPGRARGV